MKIVADLDVCTSCILAIASGVVETEDDRTAARNRAEMWGDQAAHMIAGDDGEWFSSSDCDGCGRSSGTRHRAYILRED